MLREGGVFREGWCVQGRGGVLREGRCVEGGVVC